MKARKKRRRHKYEYHRYWRDWCHSELQLWGGPGHASIAPSLPQILRQEFSQEGPSLLGNFSKRHTRLLRTLMAFDGVSLGNAETGFEGLVKRTLGSMSPIAGLSRVWNLLP